MKRIINLLIDILVEVKDINRMLLEDRQRANTVLLKEEKVSNSKRIQKI